MKDVQVKSELILIHTEDLIDDTESTEDSEALMSRFVCEFARQDKDVEENWWDFIQWAQFQGMSLSSSVHDVLDYDGPKKEDYCLYEIRCQVQNLCYMQFILSAHM